MTRRTLLLLPFLMVLASMYAVADENPLLGTWKLQSFVREVAASGERYNQLGERPDGYLSYAADGRMFAFFVSADQHARAPSPAMRSGSNCTRGCWLTAALTRYHPAK